MGLFGVYNDNEHIRFLFMHLISCLFGSSFPRKVVSFLIFGASKVSTSTYSLIAPPTPSSLIRAYTSQTGPSVELEPN
jgi:hypothetical protein